MSVEQKTLPDGLKEFSPGQDLQSWMLSVNRDLCNLGKRVSHLEMQNQDLKQLIKTFLGASNGQQAYDALAESWTSNSPTLEMITRDWAEHAKILDSSSEHFSPLLGSEGSEIDKQKSSDISSGQFFPRADSNEKKSSEKDLPQNRTRKLSSRLGPSGHHKRQENPDLNVQHWSRRRPYSGSPSAFCSGDLLQFAKHPRHSSIQSMRNRFNRVGNFREVLSNEPKKRQTKNGNRRSAAGPGKLLLTNMKSDSLSSSINIKNNIQRRKFPRVGSIKNMRAMCEQSPTGGKSESKLGQEVRVKGRGRRRVKSSLLPAMADETWQEGDNKHSIGSSVKQTSRKDTEKDSEAEKRKRLRQLLRMTLT